jgi:hypothetical protein
MNSDDRGALLTLIVGIVLVFFVTGFWTALTLYKHDTFECTNLCGGKHSIYNNDACYCKIGE